MRSVEQSWQSGAPSVEEGEQAAGAGTMTCVVPTLLIARVLQTGKPWVPWEEPPAWRQLELEEEQQ